MFTFKYDLPSSKTREEFLLSYLEKERLREITAVRAVIDTVFAGTLRNDEAGKTAMSALKSFIQLTLPSETKKSNMEGMDKMDKSAISAIKDRLKINKSKSKAK